ncbi:hypothetical protein LU293_00100 [Moraxella nasovis]|uniref:hypothetical protein n=1 Tax=Moraxella nasovis TaxID=2904121 RepID=UPI001F6235A8|nr:hypothetical protein [Moraxella nasovis]UNU73354.1 hypothetical protein LU293_00100 [Moraxella nasovis]
MAHKPLKILSTNIVDTLAEVVEIYGQGCNYPTKIGVDGFCVYFDVAINDGSKTKQFYIELQNDDRENNISIQWF